MPSFADYVKDLMEAVPKVNGNTMLSNTSMTDDNARYREDPFYMSRDIQARDQLVLDEGERRRREAALSGAGMLPTYGSDADGFEGGQGQDGGGVGGFGIGMGIGGVDAGIAGPGAGLGMSGQQGGIVGAVLGGLFGMPSLGYQVGKSLTQDAPTTVTPQAVVNAAYNNYQANQMAVDPGIQAAVQAQEAAARSAYNSRFSPTDSGSSGGGGGFIGTGNTGSSNPTGDAPI